MTSLHALPVETVVWPARLSVPLLRPADAAELLSVRPQPELQGGAYQRIAVPAHGAAHPVHARHDRGVGGSPRAAFVPERGADCKDHRRLLLELA
jgi:hypothetical protein